MTPDIALLRLAAQRIVGPRFATPTDTVRWLTAAQAQDYPGALTSIALRTEAGTRAGVEAALTAGEIVRSWPMRGTLHFVLAEDLPWMLSVAAGRVVAGMATRRAELGLDAVLIERARALAVKALADGQQLHRAELFAVWDGAGVQTAQQRGAHLISYLALTGTLCYGPVRDGQQCLVLVSDWITQPWRLERDEALGEWTLRYFRSHGPATIKDFTWWTKLTVADAKAGLAIARPDLERFELDGVEYFMDPRTPARLHDCRGQATGVLLLPGFDEYLLGYQDRRAALAPEYAQQVVPGGNGVFRSTVVAGGQVIGTWKRSAGKARSEIAATPFTTFADAVEETLPRLYAALP